jgi:hypothetical protein
LVEQVVDYQYSDDRRRAQQAPVIRQKRVGRPALT